jgi:hypothetical protein
MKKFNLKIAVKVFIGVIVFDVIMTVLNLFVPEHTVVETILAIPFWIVNFLGLPLLFIKDISAGAIVLSVITLPFLSALLWAFGAGHVFRCKSRN